jgi:DNA-binding response OmpR family regulator
MNQTDPIPRHNGISPGHRGFSVLAVDDEPANLVVIEAAIEPLGHAVMSAASAAEADAVARVRRPDLVLLDVMMPVESGIELCRRWRDDDFFSTVPVVLVTALGAADHRSDGLAAGADDFIEKPLDIDLLADRVNAWLAVGRQRHAPRTQAGGSSPAARLVAAARELAGPGEVHELALAMARAAGIDTTQLGVAAASARHRAHGGHRP